MFAHMYEDSHVHAHAGHADSHVRHQVYAHLCMHMCMQAHVCMHNTCTRSHTSMQMYTHTLDMQTHVCADMQGTRCADAHMYAGSCVYIQQMYTLTHACTCECAGSHVHIHTRHTGSHMSVRTGVRAHTCTHMQGTRCAGSQVHTPGVHTQPLLGIAVGLSGSGEEHSSGRKSDTSSSGALFKFPALHML